MRVDPDPVAVEINALLQDLVFVHVKVVVPTDVHDVDAYVRATHAVQGDVQVDLHLLAPGPVHAELVHNLRAREGGREQAWSLLRAGRRVAARVPEFS